MNRGHFGIGICLASVLTAAAGDDPAKETSPVYDFQMNSIDGKPIKLSIYQGQVLLIVNVASK